MPLPTFFVIGAMKAGTTSLHMYLDAHPEINMSTVKEPNFFARAEDGPYPSRVGSLGEYEALFTSHSCVRGESSPTYSMYPRHRGVPGRIHEMVPDARFIYLVRDPIKRIISHYLHNVAVGGVRATFAEATGDLSDRDNPYVYPSLYAMQLDQYLGYFPREAFLVLDQADLAARRRSCLERIFGFLNVNAAYHCEAFEREYGASEDRRRFAVRYVRLRDRFSPSHLRWIPSTLRRSMRRQVEGALWRPIERPVVPDEAIEKLRSVCGPEIDRLRAEWGLDLREWLTAGGSGVAG